ncbi:MAG TPA: cytochrome c [Albitalea sp.]
MKKLMWAAAAVAALATSLPAAAQFAKPEDAIKYRRAVMTVLGSHFGRVGAMAQGKAPYDPRAAAQHADIAVLMGRLPFGAFIEGTDKGETRAKPEIWAENEKFKAAEQKMQDELAKLSAAAKTGNLENLKAAFGPTGQSCKGCHDKYRKDEPAR